MRIQESVDDRKRKLDTNKSIHPRVVNGHTRHETVNTSKPRRRSVLRDRTMRAYDRRQAEYQLVKNKDGYTRPGSRNPKRVRG